MVGAVMGLLVGELVPLHQNVAEWTRQTIWNNLRRMVLLSPEMTAWQNMIFKAKNVLAGSGFGTLMQITSINIQKIIYGLAYEAQRRYNIPKINEMQNLLILTAHALQLAITAQNYEALTDDQKSDFQRHQRAIQDHFDEIKSQLPSAIEAPKGKTTTFPFPFTEAKNPTLALEAPKKPKPSRAKARSSSGSSHRQSSISDVDTSGSEIGDATKRVKKLELARQRKSAARSSGGSFIKGQVLHPIDEKYVIGSSAPLLYNDVSNDSFIVKTRTAEPVI